MFILLIPASPQKQVIELKQGIAKKSKRKSEIPERRRQRRRKRVHNGRAVCFFHKKIHCIETHDLDYVEKPKDPGIPNDFPYKDRILAEVQEQRRIVSPSFSNGLRIY